MEKRNRAASATRTRPSANAADISLLTTLKLKPAGWELAKALGMSRQAIQRGLKTTKKPFLDLERLVKLYAHLKQAGEVEKCTSLRHKILERHLDLQDFLKLVPLEATPPFVEMWIFGAEPKELTDEAFTNNQMKPFLVDPSKKLVYFVPDAGVALTLWSNLMRATNNSIRGVSVVHSLVTKLMPRFAIYFEPGHSKEKPKIKAVVSTLDDNFALVPKEMSQGVISTMRSANVLSNDDRFSWPQGQDVVSIQGQITFQLVYQKL